MAGTVERVLAGRPDAPYDLVLLDPPYAVDDHTLGEVLARLAQAWLATGAVVVVERSSRSPEPGWPAGLAAEEPRRYGESTLWVAVAAG